MKIKIKLNKINKKKKKNFMLTKHDYALHRF